MVQKSRQESRNGPIYHSQGPTEDLSDAIFLKPVRLEVLVFKGGALCEGTQNGPNALQAVAATCMPACSVAQLCLALCDPMDCSPPASSVHGISQVRILE